MKLEYVPTTCPYCGTGLGLSIAKQIMKGYHGQIWVESKEGYGTTFSFTLSKQNKTNTTL